MITITTNDVPREIIYWFDLSSAEQEDFDYCDEFSSFFRYRGELYNLGEFEPVKPKFTEEFKDWAMYQSDSFFSGFVIKYIDDDKVIVGSYTS